MAVSEKYNINFETFESEVRTTWQELQTKLDFCDLTLACEDKKIQAHKAIITSSSPLLKNILKQSKENSLIYFRGLKYKDLQNVVNFMYQGEVNIDIKDLDKFLTISNDLGIKGVPELNNCSLIYKVIQSKNVLKISPQKEKPFHHKIIQKNSPKKLVDTQPENCYSETSLAIESENYKVEERTLPPLIVEVKESIYCKYDT